MARKYMVALNRSRFCYVACSDLYYSGFYGTWELPDKDTFLESNPVPEGKEWDWLRYYRYVLVIKDDMVRNQISPEDDEDRRRLSMAVQEHQLIMHEAMQMPRMENQVEKFLRDECQNQVDLAMDVTTTYAPWYFEHEVFLHYVAAGLQPHEDRPSMDRAKQQVLYWRTTFAQDNHLLMTRALMWVLPAVREVMDDIMQLNYGYFGPPAPGESHGKFSQFMEPFDLVRTLEGGYSWLPAVTYMREMLNHECWSKPDKKNFSYIGEVLLDLIKKELAARSDHGLTNSSQSHNGT